ncbi:MAG: hypothetical protein WCI51_04710 [Lentisphaerota bacterium]
MSRQKITQDSDFDGHPIHTGNNQPYILNILQAYNDRLQYMNRKYSQVAVAHIIVSTPEELDPTQANKSISKALEVLKKGLKNKGTEAQIGWVRESVDNTVSVAEEQRAHYHIGIIADGSKTQSGFGHAKHLGRLLHKQSGGVFSPGHAHCEPPDSEKYDKQAEYNQKKSSVIKIRRDKPHADEQFENALNWLNYQSKIATKGNAPHGQREFGFTRLPKQE